MRQRYFPPERNQIPAHLTLFHTLPAPSEIGQVLKEVAEQQPRFGLQVSGLRSLGRGVAYALTSPELLHLHREFSARFREHLSAQDKQKFQPHVVIQNKATGPHARELLAILQPAFRPFAVEAIGLDLWHYLGGPWKLAETFLFN